MSWSLMSGPAAITSAGTINDATTNHLLIR
jgi:hypothetical protein